MPSATCSPTSTRRSRSQPDHLHTARGRPRTPAREASGNRHSRQGKLRRAVTTWVYDFEDGSREMRDLLGGKGANVAEMTRVLGAERVPAGFTITTEACVAYMRADRTEPDGMADEVAAALQRLERRAGKRLGDPADPLLVSVRSGARESMPGMLDTVLNLGLNDESVQGLAQGDRERALRLGLLPAARADVRQRLARRARRAVRGRDPRGQAGARRQARHRARHCRTEGPDRALPGALRVPPGPGRAAEPGDPRGVRLLDGRPRGVLSPHQRDPGRVGHRGQRPADGVRQQGRHVGDRRRLQPRRDDRRARAVGRLPGRRAGRGRRVGRAQHARHRRAGGGDAGGARRADGGAAHARGPLRRHAGHGVHDRGRQAVPAADAQRQAPGAGRDSLRLRCRRRGAAHARAGARHDRPRVAGRAAAPDVRPGGRLRGAREGRQRLARRGQGRGGVHRPRRGRGRRRRTRRDPGAAFHRGRTTWPASTPRAGS